MRRIIITIIFVLMNIMALGNLKDISSIKNFTFSAREIRKVNNKERVIEYNVVAVLPDKIRKEITFPSSNEGEIHIYDGNIKKVYLPLFEIVDEKELTNEENYIIKVIQDLKVKEQEDQEFKENFYAGKVVSIPYENGIVVNFDKLERVSGYYFPVKISVYEKDVLQAEVIMKDITINEPVGKDVFDI